MTQTLDRPAGERRNDASTGASSDRYLTFLLGGEVFALPILDVTEIIEYRSLTVVPMMPAFVRGVINLRGRVVPVIDIAARFGRGGTEVGRRTGVVIVEVAIGEDETHHLGIMVDGVNKVVPLDGDDIEPAPAFGAGIRSDFVKGMARYESEFVIVLDIRRVLSLEEMVQLSRGMIEVQQTPIAG